MKKKRRHSYTDKKYMKEMLSLVEGRISDAFKSVGAGVSAAKGALGSVSDFIGGVKAFLTTHKDLIDPLMAMLTDMKSQPEVAVAEEEVVVDDTLSPDQQAQYDMYFAEELAEAKKRALSRLKS